jgi:hypothetical protein
MASAWQNRSIDDSTPKRLFSSRSTERGTGSPQRKKGR